MIFLTSKKIFILIVFLFSVFFVPGFIAQAKTIGEVIEFGVDENFDIDSRNKILAELVKVTDSLYFYVEKQWWNSQTTDKKAEILSKFDNLSLEFSSKIYPKLTSIFGKEWNPGVDGDSKITILFEAMNSGEGGYFRTADEYIKLQVPDSNEREMLYLSLDEINGGRLNTALAHEFVHLITFNQKNKSYGTEEDTWLNEARADYSSTILGYNDNYAGSNLQQRVRDFVENPSDSIVDWNGNKYDYASVSLFTHYLVDHYGVGTLTDSLKSKYVGIEGVNYALQKNGAKEDFSEIFINWTITSIVNECSFNKKYCYLNQNLKSLKINPSLNFLPLVGNSSLSVVNDTKGWTGNWLKFIGGSGDLKLDFSGIAGVNYFLPYIIEDNVGSREIKLLSLDKDQKGEIKIDNFGKDYKYLIIIPSVQSRNSILDGLESKYPFNYTVYVKGNETTDNQDVIQKLLEKIDLLKKQIAEILAQRNGTVIPQSCLKLEGNLYKGVNNISQVKCLQEFLKSQGSEIYPEGLVTGNFGNLTENAVKRFQEKYASEILSPLGISGGTGYVGNSTRQKINAMLAIGS